MTHQELSRLAALGEGIHLEFKRKVPRPERMAKEVIALANTHGGHVLLGVADDGTVVGLRDAEEEEFALRSALAEHCRPHVPVRMERVAITRRRDVIVVHVPESREKPHRLVRPGERRGRAFVRVEDKSVEASREVVALMRGEEADSVRFEFGDKELMLMRYLDAYGQITVRQFATLADIPRRRASATLVLLTRANVLRLHPDDRQDYFTLAY
ncbi:MAG: ATP-binding protein [Bacteroidetes bacterium]|nr:MAG: ATP-binding protein [Bacteroidota bacterium]